jgi:hypothetical protein
MEKLKSKNSKRIKKTIIITCFFILLVLLLPLFGYSEEWRRTRYRGLIYTVYVIHHENQFFPRVERGVEIYLFNRLIFERIHEEWSPHARIYDEDFLIEYEDAINSMFDYQWTLLSVEDIRIEPRETIPGRDDISSIPIEFTEWVIEYYDGNESLQQLVLYNHRYFHRQIISHVANLTTEYYQEHFWNVYMGELENSLSDWTRFYLRLLDICTKCAGEGLTINSYRWGLGTSEGAVRLHQFTFDNVFEMMPYYIVVRIRLKDDLEVDQIEDVASRVELMMESLNDFTENNLNAQINIVGRNMDTIYWSYIQGERLSLKHLSGCDGDGLELFERYRGVFW